MQKNGTTVLFKIGGKRPDGKTIKRATDGRIDGRKPPRKAQNTMERRGGKNIQG